MRCAECGLVRADPRAEVPGFDRAGEGCAGDKIAEAPQTRLNARERLGLVRRVTGLESGRLLDVGCYAGFFLEVFRDAGWDAVGLEPQAAPADYATRELGLHVVRGAVEDARFDPASFDLVTFNHCLEHADDPALAIERCRDWLAPGGHLFVETPDFRNPWLGLLGSRWRQFIADHYTFFDPDTLHDLLLRRGFRIVHLSRAAKAFSLNLLADRVGRYYFKPAGRALSAVFGGLGVGSKTIRLDPRDLMVAVAVKEE